MAATAPSTQSISNLTFSLENEIHIKAPIDVTFESLIEEMGQGFTSLDNRPMMLKLEAWPGGRWYRDLGDNNGHLWGHVQAIKRPTLLEISGPLMLSYASVHNVQYRLSEVDGGTLIKFHHYAVGAIPDDARSGFSQGWSHINGNVQRRAEAKLAK
jgi:uncharacterized protein YndB with AHSA1/START domain